MNKSYKIGSCPICLQGILEIEKEISSGKVIICCDECEAEWEQPVDALVGKNGSRFKYGRTTHATLFDISQLGWEHYLI